MFAACKRPPSTKSGSRQLFLVMIALLLPLGALQAQTTVQAEAGTLAGKAKISTCSACSGGKKVGFIGNGSGNTVTLTVNVASAGAYPITVAYLVSGKRSFSVSVNGGA